ncbi:unnamed protein product, partial [marine sediment metagenome]
IPAPFLFNNLLSKGAGLFKKDSRSGEGII